MQCPYCAEKIKDEAIVCKHCGRDFGLHRPLMDRLVEVEGAISTLSRHGRRGSAPHAGPGLALLVGALCLVVTGTTFWAVFAPAFPTEGFARTLAQKDPDLILAALAPPAVLGLVLGAAWKREPTALKFLAGIPLAWLNLGIVLGVLGTVQGADPNWPWILLVFNFGQPLIHASAAWMADLWVRRRPALGLRSLFKTSQVWLAVAAQLASQLLTFLALARAFSST